MKMKKGLLIVVVLLAMASLMAAMAYNSARVTNPSVMQLTNSSKAYLSIAKAHHYTEAGYKDQNVYEKDGVFKLDFTRGVQWTVHGDGAALTGFQPGSIYKFDTLVNVYNNSTDAIEFWLETEGLSDYVTIKAGSTTLIENGQPTGAKAVLGGSTGARLSFEFNVPLTLKEGESLNTLMNGNLIINAQPR